MFNEWIRSCLFALVMVETAQFVFSLLADEPDRGARAQPPERISEGDALVTAETRRVSRRPE